MEEIFKNVNLLYIIHNGSILMRKSIHQNYEVMDVFSFKDDNDIEKILKINLLVYSEKLSHIIIMET